MNHPFVWHPSAVDAPCSSATLIASLVIIALMFKQPLLHLIRTPKCKSSEAGNLHMPQRSREGFPSSERVGDADSEWPGVSVALWTRWDKLTRNTEILWRKRDDAAPLSVKERATPALAWTGFYFFSGHITLRMAFIYYAEVRFRWLPFTENKGEGVANYIKKEGYLQM